MGDRLAALVVALPFALGAVAAPAGPAEGSVVFRFEDPAIVESSGLVVHDGRFLTTNDSGDTGRVFEVDPATGETVGVSTWSSAPTDVEALAPGGPGLVWVGDIGDNGRSRESILVAHVAVGDVVEEGPAPRTFTLSYPGSAQDAEALLAHPVTGRLYVASKNVFGGTLYAAPRRLGGGANRMTELGRVMPIVTDGAFFPDGRHLVLRDYGRMVVYTFPELEAVADVTLPRQRQGEGIAVDGDGRVFVSSEGLRAPVHEVALPAAVRRVVQEEEAEPSASPPAAPTATSPAPGSREETELPQPEEADRPVWPWLLMGGIGALVVVVLLRSLRPR